MDNDKKIFNIMKEGLRKANGLTGGLIYKINTEKGKSKDFSNVDMQHVHDELYKIWEVLGRACGSLEMYEHEWFDKM